MNVPLLNRETWLKTLAESRLQLPVGAKAMYSSWWQGIVTDPSLMLVPIDDHMVHRGDGIFEAARSVNGALFDLEAHLQRLVRSAEHISLKLPFELSQIADICVQTVRASGLKDATLRLYVGRGPGSFTPNPYESPNSQLYIVVTDFRPMPENKYLFGVRAVISKIPQKAEFFTQIKSCNYLPNVLMKKESVDAQVDFSLGCRDDGTIYEGPTENVAMLSQDQVLHIPKFDYTLRGTTLMAVVEALRAKPDPMFVKNIQFSDLKIKDFLAAKEAFVVGTTLEVLPLVEIDGKKVGTGKPGPVAVELRKRLHILMKEDPSKRTEIY